MTLRKTRLVEESFGVRIYCAIVMVTLLLLSITQVFGVESGCPTGCDTPVTNTTVSNPVPSTQEAENDLVFRLYRALTAADRESLLEISSGILELKVRGYSESGTQQSSAAFT